MDFALGHRQCAMFNRIGREFMQCETDVLCRHRTQYQMRALIMYPRPVLLDERGKLARRQVVKRNTMPILIGDEVMSMSKTLDAGCQTRNIIFNGPALRRCLPGDSLHDGQQILGAVSQFTRVVPFPSRAVRCHRYWATSGQCQNCPDGECHPSVAAGPRWRLHA